ncbi:peptidylprolyl isomerase [Sulfurimonas sp. SAG-AH-194-I05]|nr:peptidylprolyl isomerase [Sulfurimonas sp. SAG-AH-194-I05]MDF1874360.1 peptidylprolyl isomerase [Sulfurimonas sp. SAG-AH-194-I05]
MKRIQNTLLAMSMAATLSLANTDTYAVVNGEIITKNQVVISLKNQNIDFSSLNKKQQKEIGNKIIEQKLLSQYALKSDAIKSPEYLEKLDKVKGNIALQVFLKNGIKKIKVSTNEIKDFYTKNSYLFIEPAQYRARHILVKTKKKAVELINELKKSKQLKNTFIALAKKNSTGPSSKDGGNLGWFSSNKMVAEFGKAVSSLKKNAITLNPVKTQYGYHVIYLEDKKDKGTIKLSQVEVEIKQKIMADKLEKKMLTLIKELKKSAKVEYK